MHAAGDLRRAARRLRHVYRPGRILSASVECPACQRRLVARPGHRGTFKSACVYEGCGAELLCTVGATGDFEVKGPRLLHEEESRRQLAVRASSSLRSFWAPAAGVVSTLLALSIYVLPFAFAGFGAAVGILATLGFVAVGVLLLVGLWLAKRFTTKQEAPLPAIEGALEAWAEPEGYRG